MPKFRDQQSHNFNKKPLLNEQRFKGNFYNLMLFKQANHQ